MQDYSLSNTVVLIQGVALSGYDEGDDVITLDRLNDSTTHTICVDGEMSVSLSDDRSGTATFRLMQTSDSNAFLSGLLIAQENGAFVPLFVQFKDTRGNDLASGTQGYINRPAPMIRGTNVNSQEWILTFERLDFIHAGA